MLLIHIAEGPVPTNNKEERRGQVSPKVDTG